MVCTRGPIKLTGLWRRNQRVFQAGLQGRDALCVPWDPSCCFRRACGMLDPAECGSTTCAAWQPRSVGPPPLPHAGAAPVPYQSCGHLAE